MERHGFVLGKLVLIEWIDSASVSGFWNRVEVLLENTAATFCTSVGWIVHEDRQFVTLAAHLSAQHVKRDLTTSVAGDITIPKVAITKRRVLR